MSASTRALIVCGDLFFSTQLRSSAEAAGAQVDVEMLSSRVNDQLAQTTYSHIVVDLELPGLDVAALVEGLPAEHRPTVIAFGPHVHTARLQAAQQAGCNQVVSRGQIAGSLKSMLTGKTNE